VGTRLEYTAALLGPVEDLLKTLPDTELENFVTTIGKSGDDREMLVSAETGSHFAQIYVYLTPEAGRKRKTQEIIHELREKGQSIQGFDKLTFEEIHPGPPVGKPIAVKIRGEQFDNLKGISKRIQEYLKTIDGIMDIKDDFTGGKEELRVMIDTQKSKRLFLTTYDIAHTVRYAFEGGIATVIKTTDEEIDVIVKFPEDHQLSFDSFNSILIPNKYDKLIPLNKVATLETQKGISSIKHLDRKRFITVTANVDEEVITSAAVNKRLAKQFKDINKEFIDDLLCFSFSSGFRGQININLCKMTSCFRRGQHFSIIT